MKLGIFRILTATLALGAATILPASAADDSFAHLYSFNQTQADGSYFSGTFRGFDFNGDGFLNPDDIQLETFKVFDGRRGVGDNRFLAAYGYMTFDLAKFKADPGSNSLLYFSMWSECWHCSGYSRRLESQDSQTTYAYSVAQENPDPYSSDVPPPLYFSKQINGHIEIHDLTVSAVPEPGTYGMLLAGLGLLGWVARRRRA